MQLNLITAPTIEPLVSGARSQPRKRASGIYQILCKPTGKVYIGSAVYLMQRKAEHRRALSSGIHHSSHLQRAWNKYGPESFYFSVLEYCDIELLIEREQSFIDSIKSYSRDYGFNMNPTAGSGLGYKHTDEAKAKMSKNMTGFKHSNETRKLMTEMRTGKKMNLSPSERKRRKDMMIGNGWNLGRIHTAETKSKLKGCMNALGKIRTDEQKNNISLAHHPLSIEQCRAIREYYQSGISLGKIANKFDRCRQTISNVINRKLRAYQCS